MQITKLTHAALVIDKDGEQLIVDPGSFTEQIDVANPVAVVITHEHADHWDEAHLSALTTEHPGVRILGPAGVAAAVAGFDVTVVAPGDRIVVGGFSLRFTGGKHALIHESVPIVDNVGVVIDERFYYPGDSYTLPDAPIELLAAPAGAPWLKIGDAIDFVLAVQPRQSFATHESTLSAAGLALSNSRLQWATEQHGGTHHLVEPGSVLEI